MEGQGFSTPTKDLASSVGGGNVRILSNSKLWEFSAAVKYISVEKMDAVRAIGLGYTLHLGCTELVQPIIEATVKYVDPLNYKILIHGIVCYINGDEFGRVMGIHDGGEPIVLGNGKGGEQYGTAVGPMCDGEGRITVQQLIDIVSKRREVDDTFKIAFAMLALTCVICPGIDDAVDVGMLLPLMDTTRIVCKNWASFAVMRLMEGVKRHRDEGTPVVGGCIIFLQLLYLDKVGAVLTPDRDRLCTPIMYWEKNKVDEIVKKIRLTGGHKSPTVMLEKSKRTKRLQEAGHECGVWGFGLNRDVHETIMDLQLDVKSMKDRMWDMKWEVTRMQPKFVQVTKGVDMVVDEVRETLSQVKGECKRMCKQQLQLERNENANFENMDNAVKGMRWFDATKQQHSTFVVPTHDNIAAFQSGKKKGTKNDTVDVDVGVGSENSCTPKRKQFLERDNNFCTANIIQTGLKRSHANAMYGHFSEYERYASILKDKVGMSQYESGVIIRYGAGPYRLKVKLSEVEVEIIEDVYLGGKPLTAEDGRLCLGICGNGANSISRDEINCLMPRTNVSGSVINYVVAYLNKEGLSNWYWSTHFESRSQCSEGKRFTQWVAHTRRVCGLQRFDGRIDSCERVLMPFYAANGLGMEMQIFLPVHEGSMKDGHWFLIVVDMVKKVAEVWDSGPGTVLKTSRMDNISKVLRHIDRVLWFDNITQPGRMLKVEDFTIVEATNVPKQGNSFDCGVYVIQNMQHYQTDWAKEYDSDTQRSAILLDCLTAPNNELDANLRRSILKNTKGCENEARAPEGSQKKRQHQLREEWEEIEEGQYWRLPGRILPHLNNKDGN